MMPKDLSGDTLISLLERTFGYKISRQSGSHVRLTTIREGEHHLTIPKHMSLRIGTVQSILQSIGEHFSLSKQDVINKLFG